MRPVCARCQTSLQWLPLGRRAKEAASHGFCLPCHITLANQGGSELLALVEEVPYIALVVDSGLCIRAANHLACGFFEAAWVSLLGRRVEAFLSDDPPAPLHPGQVEQPAPAGRVHALLVRTLQGREGGVVTVPPLKVKAPEAPSEAALQVSSLSVGDWVLLRIEPQLAPDACKPSSRLGLARRMLSLIR